MQIQMDSSGELPLYQQLYRALRDQILSGELKPGQRLPPSRALAATLGLSRNVVILAYQQLQASGLVEGRQGSATRVAGDAVFLAGTGQSPTQTAAVDWADFPLPGPRLLQVDFRSGLPDGAQFPRGLWGRLWLKALRGMPDADLGYGPVQGYAPLREALVSYLRQHRGVRATPGQVLITTGATQGLSLLMQVLLRPGDTLVCENPCHPLVPALVRQSGAKVIPVDVDGRGMKTDQLRARLAELDKPPRMIYLTPSHQFPSGAVLDLARRHELSALAQSVGALIVEDDYDSEIRHEGMPLPALQGLAPVNVAYVGSFSKLLAPALRLGYVIVPTELLSPILRRKLTGDYHTPAIEQRALAAFIAEGHLERHLGRMRRLYQAKRRLLTDTLAKAFGSRAICRGDRTGLHLWLELESPWSGRALAEAATQEGVGIYPLADYRLTEEERANRCDLVLGYGGLSPDQIRQGVAKLARVEARRPQGPNPPSKSVSDRMPTTACSSGSPTRTAGAPG